MIIMNDITEKILILLWGGLEFGYSYSPGKKWRALKNVSRRWKQIDEAALHKGIRSLYRLDIIDKIEDLQGFKITLTDKGRFRALNIALNSIKSKGGLWDGKWRMVAFDIPEKYKKGRDALRQRLRKIGFCELQKSILISPYDCEKEMLQLVEFFHVEKYVRFGILEKIDNESYFRGKFKITKSLK